EAGERHEVPPAAQRNLRCPREDPRNSESVGCRKVDVHACAATDGLERVLREGPCTGVREPPLCASVERPCATERHGCEEGLEDDRECCIGLNQGKRDEGHARG